MADAKFIAGLIGVMSVAYPYYADKVNDKMIALYAKLLEDLPEEALKLAAEKCMTTGKFFPSVADLREAAAQIVTGVDTLPLATEAWGEFCKIIRRLGYFEEPVFENPITKKVVEALGWKQLAYHDNESVAQAQFHKLYEGYLKREAQEVVKTPALKAAEGEAILMMSNVAKQKQLKKGGE